MKLSRKLFFIQLVFFLFLMSGVLLTIIVFVLPDVRKVETQSHLGSISRVVNTIEGELENLRIVAVDWGEWDDTYHYASTQNKAFERSALTQKSLTDLEVDLLFILNSKHELLWKMTSEELPEPEKTPLISGNKWNAQHPLLQTPSKPLQGIFLSKSGPLLITRHPILTSQGEGPQRGYIFFAERLSAALTKKFADKIKTSFSTKVVDNSQQTKKVTFLSDDKSHSQGFIPLLNSDNKIIQIDIFQPRPFYQQVLNATKYSIIAVLIIGLISCFITYFLLRKMLVNPIILLQKQADMFRKHDGKQSFKLLNRTDELGQLSSSFVSMAKDLSRDWGILEQQKRDYKDASYTDVLTGLKNRRYLKDYLQDSKTWIYDDEWTFFSIDLDHFKHVNDKYGHDVGDITLRQFSDLLRKSCRDSDIIIRSGGEEFTVLCHQTSSDVAKIIAERIRNEVAQYNFGHEPPVKLTCSIGFFIIRIYSREYGLKHWSNMIKVSDIALYAAKNSGRNTWVGLECLEECADGTYPKESIDIKHWLAEKKLKLLSFNKAPDDVTW